MENKETNPVKETVKEKYAEIALQRRDPGIDSCCGGIACCGNNSERIMADDYSELEGYVAEADLGLGCGLPTEFAQIKEGDTVVDLGSGAGNDAFIARRLAGEKGKVIGIDFTEEMIALARENVQKLGFRNIEFRHGDIESMPLENNIADVVVSNCVLNLVPDKHKVFREIFRILKPGGHFSISDIVLEGQLPDRLRSVAEMYAGCVSGAVSLSEYLEAVQAAGFGQVQIQKSKTIDIPQSLLSKYLLEGELKLLAEKEVVIKSITLFGEKPISGKEPCCNPGCCDN